MKYLLRNQSVIVREFQGQLKSTLVCPVCGGISKIFDPFMFLSLPLPIKKTRTIFVSMVKAEPGQPIVKVGREREVYWFLVEFHEGLEKPLLVYQCTE